jgi:hypothetical protein
VHLLSEGARVTSCGQRRQANAEATLTPRIQVLLQRLGIGVGSETLTNAARGTSIDDSGWNFAGGKVKACLGDGLYGRFESGPSRKSATAGAVVSTRAGQPTSESRA